MNTEFITREEYKQFVKEWKGFYKVLTNVIRKSKHAHRNIEVVSKGGDFTYGIGFRKVFKDQKKTEYYNSQMAIIDQVFVELNEQCVQHHFAGYAVHGTTKHALKSLARVLLETRKQSKIRSHEQWLKEKRLTPSQP
jgi:glyoxylate carboligase